MAKTPKSSAKKQSKSPKKETEIEDATLVDATKNADAEPNEASFNEPDTGEVEDASAKTEEPKDGAAENIEASSAEKTDTTTIDTVVDEDKASQSSEPEPEPEPEPVQASQPTQAPQSAGIFGSVIGGAIAGGIGFLICMMIFPQGWQERENSALNALQSDVAAQGDSLAEANSQLTALNEGLTAELASAQSTIEAQQSDLDALIERFEALTRGDGITDLPDDVKILLNTQRDELASLRSQVEGMTADAQARIEAAAAQQLSAEEAEARVKARGALQRVRLALVNGDPFADAIDEIAGAVEVPEGLITVASDGAPTAEDVQSSYPAAAREALGQAFRAEASSDTQGRLRLFLQDQLKARSLTPQEGDSGDAILSRAEAAVKAEDYAGALAELDGLPDAAKAEMEAWMARAQARLDAVAGYEAVSAALNDT